MKKLFTTLLIVAGVYTASHAQKGQAAFGIGAGVNGSFASVNADNSSGTSTRLDYNVSIQGEYYVSNDFSLKLKGIYDKKGWAGGFYNDVVNKKSAVDVEYTLNYVTIPLLVTWHPGTEKLWYFNAGPYIGFLLNTDNTYNHQNQKSDFKSTDAGFDVGLGIQFPVSYKNPKEKFFVEYGWQVGVTNIEAVTANGASANNVRQALGVGFRF